MPKEVKDVKEVKKAAPSLARGESFPPVPRGTGTIMSGIFASLFLAVPIAGAAVLEPVFKPESILASYVAIPDPLAAPIAAVLFHLFVVQWLAMCVNAARVRYSVPWPTMYVEPSHPYATEYNCAQRAHQHVLEQTPMLFALVACVASKYPLTAAAASMLFSFSKIVGNVFGYARGNSKAKARGGFGYLGLLTLVGLAGLVGLQKAGLVDSFTTKVEDAVEAVIPYVNASIETAKPHVIKAYDAACHHVNASIETAKPHVYRAYDVASEQLYASIETAKPHVYKAYDAAYSAAAPYVKIVAEKAEPHVAKAMEYFS